MQAIPAQTEQVNIRLLQVATQEDANTQRRV